MMNGFQGLKEMNENVLYNKKSIVRSVFHKDISLRLLNTLLGKIEH